MLTSKISLTVRVSMPAPPEDLQDDIRALEAVWLCSSPDSYTTGAFLKDGGLIYLERDGENCYQSCVRSPGQLAVVKPEMCSEWCAVPHDALREVVRKALQYYHKLGLLTEDNKPIFPPGRDTKAEVAKHLRPSAMLACEASLMAAGENDDGPGIENCKNTPFCRLCETWVDETHLSCGSHHQARCDVKRTEVGEERPYLKQIEYGGEQPVLSFVSLHDVNLSLPNKWPATMRLIRIELAHVSAGASGTGYGILLAPSTEKEQSIYFGLSLEGCRGTDYHGIARFKPESVGWKEQCWKILAGSEDGVASNQNPEELIRMYHEFMLHKVLPNLMPKVGEDVATLPVAGLLVRLLSNGSGTDSCFNWLEMLRVVRAERLKVLDKMLQQSIEDVDWAVADGSSCSLVSDVVVSDIDIFRASSGPPTEVMVADAPFWLVPVLHRWYRLHDFESVAHRYAPVFPGLSPLVLEAALTMPITGLKDLPFDAYRAMGSKVLGLLTAVTAHARMPDSHHKQILQKIVDMLPRDKLSGLMLKSFPTDMMASVISQLDVRLWAPPGTQCHPLQEPVVSKSPNNEDLANIAEALVGAYFLSEGSFFSAWQFLCWLAPQYAEEGAQTWEKAVLGHLLFGAGKTFRGRTASYEELQEIVDTSENILRVKYSDKNHLGWIEYRRSARNRKFPEERRELGANKWESLVWVHKHRAFVSNIHAFSSKDLVQVPNKVREWILGKPIVALATVKLYTVKMNKDKSSGSQTESPPTPKYSHLQEKITGELLVTYRDHVVFVYKRSDDGNLGIEQEAEASRKSKGSLVRSGLMYSEILKTLKSSILKMPLPNKVTEWIHNHKCLAWIVASHSTDLDVCRLIDQKSSVNLTCDGSAVTWQYNDGHTTRCFECSVHFVPHGPVGLVLTEREITDQGTPQPMEELIYSEEMRTWLSPALTKTFNRMEPWKQGVPVPAQVLDWLRQNTLKPLREPINRSSSFRTHYFKMPWSVVPHWVRTMVPSSIDLATLESDVLKYTFTNPMLLTEALTHASYHKANNPPNTRLATLGRWLVDTMLTMGIIQRTGFPMHTTRIAEEDVEGKEPSQTFAVSALGNSSEDDGLKWPRIPSATEADNWLTEGLRSKDGPGSQRMLTDSDRLLEWVNSSCNHVTYAYICCQMDIHKYILHNSEELLSDIPHFAKIAQHASAKPDLLWITLSVHDAPRVLSDTLLAVAAAVFLDSDWSNFQKGV